MANISDDIDAPKELAVDIICLLCYAEVAMLHVHTHEEESLTASYKLYACMNCGSVLRRAYDAVPVQMSGHSGENWWLNNAGDAQWSSEDRARLLRATTQGRG